MTHTQAYARPYPAIIHAAGRHVRPPSGDVREYLARRLAGAPTARAADLLTGTGSVPRG